jgi:hypothetical protein
MTALSEVAAPEPLDEFLRSSLARLADVLIPGDDAMPSARDAGVAGPLMERVMSVRPNDTPRFLALLDGAAKALERGAGPEVYLSMLRSTDPAAFALLSGFVVGAYFLDERARVVIGYPGQGPSETSYADETGYISEGLLDPVMKRGQRAT